MKKRFLRQLKKSYQTVVKSLSASEGKTVLGLWGGEQIKKLRNLGQELVIMQMG